MSSIFKEPGDPIGGSPLDVWLRALKRWARSHELHSAPGYRKIPNAGGGFSLVIENKATDGGADPFSIYQSDTWLKFKVRTGYVIQTGEPIVPTAVETEFTITTGVAEYWFYLDLTSTPEVKTSATTLTWSSSLIPIGWVDTDTYSADSRSVITQFLRDHVFVPC